MRRLKQFFHKLSIRKKMLTILCLVGMLPVLVLGISLGINSYRTVLKYREKDMTNTLQQACGIVDYQMYACQQMMNYFVYNQDVINFLECDPTKKTQRYELYQEVSVNGKEYLLVHGGLGNYRKDKDMEEYDLHELVWSRIDYEKSYYEDFYDYIITGHTPTLTIPGMATPASVYRKNQHIAIDCGACFEGGRLAAICLDTGEEFYSQANMQK